MDSVRLENAAGIRPRFGFDAWDAAGAFIFRALTRSAVFRRRRARYFRVNATGRYFRIESREKTVEVAVADSDLN